MKRWSVRKENGCWWYRGSAANGYGVIGATPTWASAMERVHEQLELWALRSEPSA